MTTTIDTLAKIIHGTAAGYDLGCRSAGGCANHGSAEWLTCKEAAAAYRSDFALSKLPADEPIARKALEIPKTPRRAPAPAAPAKAAPRPRAAAAPSTHTPAAQPQAAPSAPEHGTLDGYWLGGCYRDDSCPANPSCAEVNLAHNRGESIEPTPARQAAAPTVSSRPKRESAPREPVHGTVYGWRRGCRVPEECPSALAGGISCSEEKQRYYANYRATRKAGGGPEINHGTPSGYQLGCHDRATCPGGADGTSCADASLAAERQRRRARGIPERPPVVDSAAAIAHIAELRSAGMPITEIIKRSGVGRTAIRTLVYGRDDYTPDGPGPRHREIPAHIEQRKAEQILEVPLPRAVRRIPGPARLRAAS